ncbi:MAG TPA: hypothetical protein VG873_02865 [Burkholderiales bacterium]|nr:hypothetical protein [Burkholderiales bacterium]
MIAASRFLCAAALAGAALSGHAQTQVWVNAGFISRHFDRSTDYREENWGLGAEAVFAPAHAAVAGTFINSERQRSRYLGYQWRGLRRQPAGVDVHAGVILALVDGYPATRNGNAFLAPVPYVAIEGRRVGVNFVMLHNGETAALAMQLKLRIR